MVNKELYFYNPTFTYIGNCVEILQSRTENTCSKQTVSTALSTQHLSPRSLRDFQSRAKPKLMGLF